MLSVAFREKTLRVKIEKKVRQKVYFVGPLSH